MYFYMYIYCKHFNIVINRNGREQKGQIAIFAILANLTEDKFTHALRHNNRSQLKRSTRTYVLIYRIRVKT